MSIEDRIHIHYISSTASVSLDELPNEGILFHFRSSKFETAWLELVVLLTQDEIRIVVYTYTCDDNTAVFTVVKLQSESKRRWAS